MESIETKLSALLSGQTKDDEEEKEYLNVDYSLQQQNYELTSKGIEPKCANEFKPKVGLTITYVVGAVVFNEKQEVLMMQEAKSSCAGTWYLPAGRVEPGESFEQAVQREVFEETGLEFSPTTLLKVESSHGTWFRFIYTGTVIGGNLKTVAKADQESLQACFVQDLSKLSLRSNDCLKLIELGREYIKHQQDWHAPQLAIHRPVTSLLLRLLVCIRSKRNNFYFALISDSLVPHLPVCEVNPSRSVHASLKRFMQHIFGNEQQLPQHKPCGLLAVEHNYSPPSSSQTDGLCLTLLVICKDPLEDVTTKTGYVWRQLDSSLDSLLQSKLTNKHKTIAFSVV